MVGSESYGEVCQSLFEFRDARDWQQFHTPRNLILAMTGELGELASLFQWVPDVEIGAWAQEPANRQRLTEEIGDVYAYLILFAAAVDINPVVALKEKMMQNAEKYPIAKSHGNSQKYVEFHGPSTAS